MVLFKRRNKFDGLSVKIGKTFSRLGLTPNQWTITSLLVVLAALYFLLNRDFLTAAILFIISSFLDMVDGSVARATGKASKKGAYLDTIVDRYVEAIIIIGLVFISLPSFYLAARVWLVIYLFGGLMTTYAKAAAKEKGLVFKELKGGALERAERLLILFAGLLLASVSSYYLTIVIVALAISTNVTALQRIAAALKSA